MWFLWLLKKQYVIIRVKILAIVCYFLWFNKVFKRNIFSYYLMDAIKCALCMMDGWFYGEFSKRVIWLVLVIKLVKTQPKNVIVKVRISSTIVFIKRMPVVYRPMFRHSVGWNLVKCKTLVPLYYRWNMYIYVDFQEHAVSNLLVILDVAFPSQK